MKQLHYTLILPYLNYGILSWGSTYNPRVSELRVLQDKCIRIRNIFFAHSRESATPFYTELIWNPKL